MYTAQRATMRMSNVNSDDVNVALRVFGIDLDVLAVEHVLVVQCLVQPLGLLAGQLVELFSCCEE